jgi:hypothetical protein
MRFIKDIYFVASYLLAISQLFFLLIMVYCRIKYGRIFYYGNTDYPELISITYFGILRSLTYTTFVFMIAWAILTPLAVFANRDNANKDYRDMIVGAASFICAIIIILTDPFGMTKWVFN